MQYFRFYVNAERFTYIVELKTVSIQEQQFVVTSALRHPDFVGKVDEFSRLCRSNEQYRLVSDFEEDFKKMTSMINDTNRLIDQDMLDRILLQVCHQHISIYGRLLYIDLLMYMDVYIHVIQAVFNEPMKVYHNIYRRATYLVLNSYPNNILFQNAFGGLYSWTETPE